MFEREVKGKEEFEGGVWEEKKLKVKKGKKRKYEKKEE